MKIVKDLHKLGKLIIVPESSDDLYIIYNVLNKGDLLTAKTSRKVKKGSTGSERTVRINLTIELEVIDTEFHGFDEAIRVKGLIRSASDESISLGSHHSINIKLNKQITITKEKWMHSEREMLKDAQLGASTGLIVIAIDDEGAVVSLIGSHASKIILEENPTITRKGSDPNQYQQSLSELFDKLISFLKDMKNEGKLENIVIGGPGFVHNQFYDKLKNTTPSIAKLAIDVAINNSGINGIREIIANHLPDRIANENSAKKQSDLVDEVLDNLGRNTGLVAYAEDVYKASEIGAIEHLLIHDSQLHQSVELRNRVSKLMDTVRSARGKVTIMSSSHSSGDIIAGFGNLVALLRYKVPK